MTARLAIAAAVAVVVVGAAGCSFDRRSDDYVCNLPSECPPGRTCDQGWCVPLPGFADAAIDAGEPADAGPTDDGAPADGFVCPPPPTCNSCDELGTCIISCTANDSCAQQVVCPEGMRCKVECQGTNSCAGGINCSGMRTCIVECTGSGSCLGAITCGSGYCGVECAAGSSCAGGIDCSQACACDVVCNGTCTPTCPPDLPMRCRTSTSCTSLPVTQCSSC